MLKNYQKVSKLFDSAERLENSFRPLMTNTNQNSTDFGCVRVKTGKSSCFSSSQTVLEFTFDETNDVKLIVSQNLTPRNYSIERAVAEAFLSKILSILEKPEVLYGSRCTIYYSSDVEWRNLKFIEGETSGKIKTLSNEFLIEELEGIIAETEDDKNREKARAVLAKGVHRRAIEIYLTVKGFAAKYLK